MGSGRVGERRARSVLISQAAGGIVIDDADFASTTWAGPLSKALGGVGITLRIGSDSASFALQRFDDGELVGDLSDYASTQKPSIVAERERARVGHERFAAGPIERQAKHRPRVARRRRALEPRPRGTWGMAAPLGDRRRP